MAPLSQRNDQQDVAPLFTNAMSENTASLSSGCDMAHQDIVACRFWEAEESPVGHGPATRNAFLGGGLLSCLPFLQGELDGDLCESFAIPEPIVRELPGRQTSDCLSTCLKKFDVLYSMSPFDVALPRSQQLCTSCDPLGDASGNPASAHNRKIVDISDVHKVLAGDSVIEVFGGSNKTSEVPLSWLTILQLPFTLTMENHSLFRSCVSCPRPHELGSTLRPQTSPSWWTRTVPALQADAQVRGAPAEFIVETDAAELIDSAQAMSKAMSEAYCSVMSLKGNKHAPNQDRAVCASLGRGAVQLLAVLDGHGSSGHVVADVSSEILPKLLLQGLANAGTSFPLVADADAKAGCQKASDAAFVALQGFFQGVTCSSNGFQGSTAVDAWESGTTATVVLLFPEQSALVAHVGDSRAILATRPRDQLSAPWSVSELTHDHKPDFPAERARIERAGAQVGTPNPYDPTPRVFTPGQTWPYIAMSRSVGDLHAHTQGVSAVPETSVFGKLYDPSTEEAILIICSDGVWDVLDVATVIEFADVRYDSEQAASAVACEAYARWSDLGYEEGYVDDITVVVKFLSPCCNVSV